MFPALNGYGNIIYAWFQDFCALDCLPARRIRGVNQDTVMENQKEREIVPCNESDVEFYAWFQDVSALEYLTARRRLRRQSRLVMENKKEGETVTCTGGMWKVSIILYKWFYQNCPLGLTLSTPDLVCSYDR